MESRKIERPKEKKAEEKTEEKIKGALKKSASPMPLESEDLLEKILAEHYAAQDKLDVPLTDVPLSLKDGHYVELVVVEGQEQKDKEKKALKEERTLGREEQSAYWEEVHQAKQPVALEALFDAPKEGQAAPKKLLVRPCRHWQEHAVPIHCLALGAGATVERAVQRRILGAVAGARQLR